MLVCAVLLYGCGGSSETGGGGQTTRPTTISTPPTIPSQDIPDEGCPVTQPLRLQPVPETEAEATLVNELVVCTDADSQQTLLTNTDDDAVWVIDRPSGLRWDETANDLTESATVQAFRASVRQVYESDLLTLEPGVSATLDVHPSEVHLYLDTGVQLVWSSIALFRDTVIEQSTNALQSLLSRGSPGRQMVVECAVYGYGAIDSLATFETPHAALVNVLGLVSGSGGCAEAVNRYQLSRGQQPSVLITDLAAHAESTRPWANIADDLLSLSRIGFRFHF